MARAIYVVNEANEVQMVFQAVFCRANRNTSTGVTGTDVAVGRGADHLGMGHKCQEWRYESVGRA